MAFGHESHIGPWHGIFLWAHPRMISAVPFGLLVTNTTSQLFARTVVSMSDIKSGRPRFRVSQMVTEVSNVQPLSSFS